jgi:hypothetical protein
MRSTLFFLRQIGFDPVRFIKFLENSPRYFITLFRYSVQNRFKKVSIAPVFADFHQEGGDASGHYFWQDLLCAKWIFESNPKDHLDIGSRIDGFVAHLLAYRQVDVLDIRPILSNVPGLTFHLGDAQSPLPQFEGRYASVSSLHAVEHFGLGRYGDQIDKLGHEKGLKNIAACVKVQGELYISFPIGKVATEFNSQRIIDPNWPLKILVNFELVDFILIPWKAEPVFELSPSLVNSNEPGQAGLYRLKRKY